MDKRALAAHLSCSVRSIQSAMVEGLPYSIVFGRAKFRVSEVEPWLEKHGYLVRHGTTLDDDNDEVAGRRWNAPGPDTRG